MNKGVSIVMCCYNSSPRLPDTFRHIAGQVVPAGVQWELVIVDNGSRDNTIGVAQEEWQATGAPCPMIVISEPQQGAGFARMAGVRASHYQYILFCDDDNWLAPDYISLALEIMEKDPQLGMCGGRAEPVFEEDYCPGWFAQYKWAFACGELMPEDGYLDRRTMTMYSAGLMVKKEAIMRVLDTSYQFLLTGRRGQSMKGAGEDSEMVMAIRLAGYEGYYTGRLVFRHFMTRGRMKFSYLVRLLYGAALSSAQLYIYADVTRYIHSGNPRYRSNWVRDLAKAVYGAFLIRFRTAKDLAVIAAKMSGAVISVISNIPNYRKYQQKIKRLYEDTHKGA